MTHRVYLACVMNWL